MANTSNQKLSVLLPIEDYGWIARYAQQNDMTPSQVVRKAVRVFISATNKKKKEKFELAEQDQKGAKVNGDNVS